MNAQASLTSLRFLATAAAVAVSFLNACPRTCSAEVTPAEAVARVETWLGRAQTAPTGGVVTFANENGNIYHLVALKTGGFVAVAAVSNDILGFTATTPIPVEDDGAPLWNIIAHQVGAGYSAGDGLLYDAAARPRFRVTAEEPPISQNAASSPRRLAATPPYSGNSHADEGDLLERDYEYLVDDPRVSIFVTSSWAQGAGLFNADPWMPWRPTKNGPALIGCVATALAQIMRYNEYPSSARPSVSVECFLGRNMLGEGSGYVTTNMTTRGGTYNWADMPALMSGYTTAAQTNAVARLCYDAAVAVRSRFDDTGTGSFTGCVPGALKDVFGYAGAEWISVNKDMALLQNTLLANLDAGKPCFLAVPGHAVVGDGYCYHAGDLYVHFNQGYGNLGNYYLDYWVRQFDNRYHYGDNWDDNRGVIDSVAYNIFPTGKCELVTGRVLDAEGSPVSGATVTAEIRGGGTAMLTATSNARGIYALAIPSTNAVVRLSATKDALSSELKALVIAPSRSKTLLNVQWSGLSTVSTYDDATPSCGNSWGNDLTLRTAGEQTSLAWVDERAATTLLTGDWTLPIPTYDGETEYAAIKGKASFSPLAAHGGNVVTMTVTVKMTKATDLADPDDEAQAAIRMGESGGLEVWIGEWLPVAAAGFTPIEGTECVFRVTLDYRCGRYSVQVYDGGTWKYLVASVGTRFKMARSGKRLSLVEFAGEGSVKSILGEWTKKQHGFSMLVR